MITQETFDSVVTENVEEFGMEMAEAVKDAREQFEQQGVNLSNIVLSEGGSQVVVEAVGALFKDLPLAELKTQLKIVADCCRDDLAQRVLATNSGAYSALNRLVARPDVREQAALTLTTVMDTNPDHLEGQGRRRMVDLLKAEDSGVVTAGLDWLLVCCVKHEANRQSLMVQEGLLEEMAKLAEGDNRDHLIRVCRVWMAMVQDDDVRVPFGKAHEHARSLVEHHSALETMTRALARHSGDKEVLNMMLLALASLAVRNEYCQQIVDEGGLKFIHRILLNNRTHCDLVTRSLILIKVLAGNDQVKDEVGKIGGLPLILAATQQHLLKPATVEAGCNAIASVCLRQIDNCKQVMESDCAAVIALGMQQHPMQKKVQGAAAGAIRNIVSREKELSSLFVERGVEELLNQALANHGDSIGDTLRSALRDLGLKVELQEHWNGDKMNIKHDFRESEEIDAAA